MNSLGEQQVIATHTLLETEKASKWLQVTIDCENCNWELLQQVQFVLQLRDDNNAVVAFTEETAADLKSFLILFTKKALFPLENFGEEVLRKRQAENAPETAATPEPAALENRTTLAEVRDSNVTCSKHEVFLTQHELRFDVDILAPNPGIVMVTYCLGECSLQPKLPSDNKTRTDSRTQLLIHDLHSVQQKLHPPPCCIPHNVTATELIIEKDDVVELYTFPNTNNCRCQL